MLQFFLMVEILEYLCFTQPSCGFIVCFFSYIFSYICMQLIAKNTGPILNQTFCISVVLFSFRSKKVSCLFGYKPQWQVGFELTRIIFCILFLPFRCFGNDKTVVTWGLQLFLCMAEKCCFIHSCLIKYLYLSYSKNFLKAARLLSDLPPGLWTLTILMLDVLLMN